MVKIYCRSWLSWRIRNRNYPRIGSNDQRIARNGGKHSFRNRNFRSCARIYGGGFVLLLLILRISVYESGMFEKTKTENVKRGDFLSLFTNFKRFKTFFFCIFIGVPVWYVISQLVI